MRPSITAMVVVLTAAACTLLAADPPEASESENQFLPPVVEQLESERDSPHEAVSIHVFVTPEGEKPLRDGAVEYPLGTIILKQKINGIRGTELFTGMLKREPGYNPECGDWEFFTLSGDARRVTARGRIDSCMDCHLEHEETGFVARDYLIDSRPRLAVETRPSPENAEREWRDADLVTVALARSSTMIRVTEEQFYDLDPVMIMDCAIPSAVEQLRFRRARGLPDVTRDFLGTIAEAPRFNDERADRQRIPRILSESYQAASIDPFGSWSLSIDKSPADLHSDADTIVLTEGRIIVTSNNQISRSQIHEVPRHEYPTPGITSEFFGTIGEAPAFTDWFTDQEGMARIPFFLNEERAPTEQVQIYVFPPPGITDEEAEVGRQRLPLEWFDEQPLGVISFLDQCFWVTLPGMSIDRGSPAVVQIMPHVYYFKGRLYRQTLDEGPVSL